MSLTYLVHSLGSRAFAEVDRVAAATVARVAERSGVRQIVHVGGLGDDDSALSPHLRSRWEIAAVSHAGLAP
jgi:uncharacterized protein YbjT (DUF2867 family)